LKKSPISYPLSESPKPAGFCQEGVGIYDLSDSGLSSSEVMIVHEVVSVFGSKGDALAAIESLYELGYGDTEIGFLDQRAKRNVPLGEENTALAPAARPGHPSGGVARAILEAGPEDEIGRLYREGAESGSAVVTISIVDGDESEVTRILYASGALNVNSYREDTGWMT
jgi:hypothetical protein